MYRIRLNYDVPQWAYYRRCAGIAKHAPENFQVDTGAWHPCHGMASWPGDIEYDLIMSLVPDDESTLRKALKERGQEDTVIVGGLNVGYGHHKERLRMCQTGADHIVVNNRDCWQRLGKPEGMTWISNGVDRDIFKVTVPIAERTPRVLWTGCNFHCHRTNIKGWQEILIPLSKRLDDAGVPHSFRKVNSDQPERCHSTEEMVEWYNSGTVYICTSSSEGTPNPALEAASCGCTLVTTDVGNMPELIDHGYNGLMMDRSVDAMFDGIMLALADYNPMAHAMQDTIAEWDWSERSTQYYDLFERLIKEARR